MKRLITLAALLLLPTLATAQTATVSGSARFPSGGSPTRASVCFSLDGYKPQTPRVVGSYVIINSTNWCINADSNGDYSSTITRNDFIDPSGTTWLVDHKYNGLLQSRARYNINTATFDLDSAVPIDSAPAAATTSVIAQGYVHVQVAAATTWTINHNFSNQNALCLFYDSSNQMIWPDTFVLTSSTVATATFTVAQAGRASCVVAGTFSLISSSLAGALLTTPTSDQAAAGNFNLAVGGNFQWDSGTAFRATFDHANTAARTYTFPNATGTVPLLGNAQTWTAIQTHSANILPDANTRSLGNSSAAWDATLDDVVAGKVNNILYVDGVKHATITAAEAAASTGDKIIIPRGTYSLTAAVTFDVANLTVQCAQGASISLANATNTHMFIVSASGIRIEGCSLDGNRANQTTDGRGISVSADLDNVTITNNVITGTYKEAIYVNSSSNVRITNNRVSNCAQAAVSASNTSCIRYDLDSGDSDSFVWITNNDVDASASNVGGIKVVTSSGATLLKEVHIEGNRVIVGENSGQDTVGIEVFETSGTAITEARVANNTVRGENNTNTTIFGVTFGGTATQNCTIAGNEVVDARAIAIEPICLDGVVANNIVRQTNATQPASPSYGYAISGGAQRNSVTGNTCQNYEECFYVGTSAAESIIDNTFTGNIINVTSGANVIAMRVQGNHASAVVSRNAFTGNVIRGSGTGSGVAFQIGEDAGTVAENTAVGNIFTNIGTGVLLGSGVADTTLMSNNLVGNGTAVSDSGSNTLRSGNKEAAGDFFHGVKRLKANYGTALVAGDFALHANWGAGAAIGTITGTDQAWQGTVTAAGVPGASPTLILTFKDGTWTNAPLCISKMTGGTGTITDLSDSTSATAHTITFNGTPVAASTYIITSICMGR